MIKCARNRRASSVRGQNGHCSDFRCTHWQGVRAQRLHTARFILLMERSCTRWPLLLAWEVAPSGIIDMGNCHQAKAKGVEVSVDLSQLDPQHPLVTLQLLSSQTVKDLFKMLRHQLPIRAPSSCFQFSIGNRKIRVSQVPLSIYRLKDGSRLILEFIDGKAMVQVRVEVDGGSDRLSLWVPKDSTVRNLRELMVQKTRLASEMIKLSVNDKEIEDSSTVGSISHSHTVSVQLSTMGNGESVKVKQGLAVVIVCDNPSCAGYLQSCPVSLGFGDFSYPSLASHDLVKCPTCGSPCSNIDQLRFSNCEVFFEGETTDGEELAGTETFTACAGELMKGQRIAWRHLALDVSPRTPYSLQAIA